MTGKLVFPKQTLIDITIVLDESESAIIYTDGKMKCLAVRSEYL